MLLALVRPTAGSVEVLGERLHPAAPGALGRSLPRVGALIDGPAFHPHLSGRANLARLDAADATLRAPERRRAASRARVAAALDRVGLGAAAAKHYRAYSLGMRQRLALAAALLRPRELLVLDEPTNGLDPQGTREVRALVRAVAAEGTTVLFSTHLLSEVEQVATHVGVMSAGRLVAEGTLAAVLRGTAARVRVECRDPAAAARVLTGRGLTAVRTADDGAGADLGDADPEQLLAALMASGAGVRGFAVERARLEDLFVALTGEGFDVRA